MALPFSYCVLHSSASHTCAHSTLCGRDRTLQAEICCQCVVYAHSLRVMWVGAVRSNAKVIEPRPPPNTLYERAYPPYVSLCRYRPLVVPSFFVSLVPQPLPVAAHEPPACSADADATLEIRPALATDAAATLESSPASNNDADATPVETTTSPDDDDDSNSDSDRSLRLVFKFITFLNPTTFPKQNLPS